jgi:hypothetical protein
MSEREFEHYLTLLGSLLRLGPEQRAEIAEELQQHLDERLADLQAEGLGRAAAIQQALTEFGDAAGLAAQFSLVSQRRYRRWMMRMATASVTSAFMVIVLFVSFWPIGGRVALAPPTTADDGATAQDQEGAATSTGILGEPKKAEAQEENPFNKSLGQPLRQVSVASAIASAEANNAKTRDALECLTAPLLNGVTINELVEVMNTSLPMGCLVDRRSLEEESIDPDGGDFVWFLPKTRLVTMLEIVLDELELTYRLRDGIVILSTKAAAENELSVVVYDAKHLFDSLVLGEAHPSITKLAGLYSNIPLSKKTDETYSLSEFVEIMEKKLGYSEVDRKFARVASLIMSQVDPHSWEENGGVTGASISCVDQRLVVQQTERTHRKIRQLLQNLSTTVAK